MSSDQPPPSALVPRAFSVVRNLRLLYVLAFLGEFMPFIAIWVVYLTDYRGLTLAQVGLMEGFFWGVKLLLEIPSGAFADRYGRRLTFVVGFGIEAAGILMFALAGDFMWLALSYVLWSGGLAFRSGNDGAYLYDTLAAAERQAEYGDRIGVFRALGTFAFTLGGIMGAFIAAAVTLQVGVLAGMVTYASIAPVLFFMQEPPRASLTGVPASYRTTLSTAFGALRRDRALRRILLFEIGVTCFFPAHFILAQPFMRRHGVPLALFGVLEVPSRLMGTAGLLLSGRAARRFGLRAVMLTAVGGIAAGLGLLAGLDHIVAFAGFGIAQVAVGLAMPAVNAYVNDRTESAVRATILSVSPLGTSIAFAVIAPVAGVVGDTSLRLAFGVMGVGIFVATLLIYLAWSRADAGEGAPPATGSG